MKLDAIIVLYNPKNEFLDHLMEYSRYFSDVYFLDNSEIPNSLINDELRKSQNNHVIEFKENKGIAYALKHGMEKAMGNDIDYVLTMDQDSIFPFDRLDTIMKILEKNTNYGIIGLNFNSDETDISLVDVPWWLTSGNFISNRWYKELKQGFDERLFIDAVDQDICHSFREINAKVGYIKGISIKHQIGNPKTINLGFRKIHSLNYDPVRYYYIFRNNYFLYFHKDRKFFRSGLHFAKYNMFLKILFFEENKMRKLKACRLGKKDGKDGRLGKCTHNF